MFYVLTDAEGTFIKQDTIEQEELASFESMQFDLSKGTYKLYIMGEGTNMSFSHVIDEVRSVSAVEDMWFRIIRFQPVRHELFYATTDVVVDGSGIDINLDIIGLILRYKMIVDTTVSLCSLIYLIMKVPISLKSF